MLIVFIVSLVLALIAMLALVAGGTLGAVRVFEQRAINAAHFKHLPRVLEVTAMTQRNPKGRTVDGIVVHAGECVLVWPENDALLNACVMRLSKRLSWSVVDTRAYAPGSLITVRNGLNFAHTSFVIGDAGHIEPLWQHWLQVRFKVGAKPSAYTLQTDASGSHIQPVENHWLVK